MNIYQNNFNLGNNIRTSKRQILSQKNILYKNNKNQLSESKKKIKTTMRSPKLRYNLKMSSKSI